MTQRTTPPLLWVAALCLLAGRLAGATLWIEAENPVFSGVTRHPWWYDRVKKTELSGGDFISHWEKDKSGEVLYKVHASAGGTYELWLRANPIQAKLSYTVNESPFTEVSFASHEQSVNIAADEKPDLRFLAWVNAGKVTLRPGTNAVRFHFHSANNHHGMLDCFVLSSTPFQPKGTHKPEELAIRKAQDADAEEGWFAFDPARDLFFDSPIDLRFLNETFAGENGLITAKGDEFVHSGNGRPVRFWAVNGPSHSASSNDLKLAARRLAKYGVNLVRLHGAVFNNRGEADSAKVKQLQEVAAAMKEQGIYSHFSIYFPLWMKPGADHPFLKGYDGKTHPFAALMFNPEFQSVYRKWWEALLLTPDPKTGRRLVDDPAVMGVEIQNEDSFFFWTFSLDRIPDAQLQILERQFATWLKQKYGTLDAALAAWKEQRVNRDNPAEGRISFRPLWNMFSEKSFRDRDTAQFLFELQQRFYAETYAFLRKLGFKGLITASNWATASPEVFGPLEKWSYTTCDFIDRHGYFGGTHQGDNAAWSIRAGHTYSDRSALRFENSTPGKPRQYNHPAMDITYAGKPSMISETTWTRPNRYRTEAPLYLATYGALQGTDGIVHFALDGVNWSVKPGFWMQPWTLMAPSQIGQFPAASLIYRQGLIKPGAVLARVHLNTNDLLALKGTPLPQDASFDELRMADVPMGSEVKEGQRIDPLIHYAGRTEVTFGSGTQQVQRTDLGELVDRRSQTVRNSTGEVTLDYGKGLLTLNAAAAQAACGNLASKEVIQLQNLIIRSPLDLAQIVLVSLDSKPISSSRKMLLQVMTEERNTGFRTEPAGALKRIASLGKDPWQLKEMVGEIEFKTASKLRVQPLDLNGYAAGATMSGPSLKLAPRTIYYLITAE